MNKDNCKQLSTHIGKKDQDISVSDQLFTFIVNDRYIQQMAITSALQMGFSKDLYRSIENRMSILLEGKENRNPKNWIGQCLIDFESRHRIYRWQLHDMIEPVLKLYHAMREEQFKQTIQSAPQLKAVYDLIQTIAFGLLEYVTPPTPVVL
jgi:hypothetical protein